MYVYLSLYTYIHTYVFVHGERATYVHMAAHQPGTHYLGHGLYVLRPRCHTLVVIPVVIPSFKGRCHTLVAISTLSVVL